MNYPKEYLDFITHFHCDRDYFECHEVLEEYWKEIDPGNRSSVWVGLIQMAVGFYHYRRENRRGAERILTKGIKILKQHPQALEELGIVSDELQTLLEETLKNIQTGIKYRSINLPLNNELKEFLDSACLGTVSQETTPHSIIHRHSLRDRTEVIRLREEALLRRQERNSRRRN
ncbi:DUF309 domain-containing protein [Bacillus sp. SCS-153A]|uniref:DUF309 domain-containing protein n=1 Tax=Rossellomorea sedimentorum TaxID=3115294 RepID=UPI003906C4BC